MGKDSRRTTRKQGSDVKMIAKNRCSNNCKFLEVRNVKLNPLIQDDSGQREIAFCLHPNHQCAEGYPLAMAHHVWIKKMGCASYEERP